jgi:hypothetical protein
MDCVCPSPLNYEVILQIIFHFLVVRKQRRGAINRKQLTYLNSYKVTYLFLNQKFSHFLLHKTKQKQNF